MVFIAVHLVLAQRWVASHFDMDLNSTTPIRQLKAELASQLGLGAGQQQWFYLNMVMDDSASLESVGVLAHSIVEIRPSPLHTPHAASALHTPHAASALHTPHAASALPH